MTATSTSPASRWEPRPSKDYAMEAEEGEFRGSGFGEEEEDGVLGKLAKTQAPVTSRPSARAPRPRCVRCTGQLTNGAAWVEAEGRLGYLARGSRFR